MSHSYSQPTRCDQYDSMLGPCHHGLVHPQVSDGGEGLKLWKYAANKLNKQPQTDDKGWPFSLGLGMG
jgi:hypothetical protein